MSGGEGFFRLPPGGAGRAGPQAGGNAGVRRASVPPPPPPHGAGGRGGVPQGVQRTVMPNQGQPMNPQGQGMNPQGQGMNPQVVPAPPRNMIPPRYQQRPPVEICDIRRERMSESDIRDLLSDFFVIRFEKVVDDDDREYRDGRHDRHKPKGDWKTVVRTRVPGSKEDIIRQIQRLDRSKKAKTALDKKKDLSLDQQRQIEKAQEDLAAGEMDLRYHIVLAQLDQTLKPVDDHHHHHHHHHHDHGHYSRRASHHHRSRSSGHLFVRSKSRDSRDRGRSKDRKKKKMQRVSITGYYKRCPRPEQNPMLLLREKEQMMNTPAPHQQQYLQQQHMQQQQQQHMQQQRQFPQQGQGQGQGQGWRGQGGQQQQRTAPPPPAHAMGRGQGRMPAPQRPRARSVTSSGSEWSSSDEEDGFWSAGEGSKTTRTSSSSQKSPRLGRPRAGSRYLEPQPGHFGVRPGALPIRQHSRHEGNFLPFAPAPPRAPAAIEANLEAVKLRAFAAGRQEGREEGRHEGRHEEKLENRLATEEAVAIAAATPYRSHVAPPPRVIQPERRSTVRLVDPRDLDLGYRYDEEDEVERFARLDIGDRRPEGGRYRLESALSERREYERRLREGELREREERGRVRERDAREYIERRESSPGPRFINPFTPRPTRRNTVSYETPGRYYYPT